MSSFPFIAKWVLDVISRGNRTFARISREIGINPRDLEFLLNLMEHKGYLRSVEPPKRMYCPTLCRAGSEDGYPGGVTYFLTEKGKGISIKEWENI
jgi:hypothetical protein